MFHQPDAGDLIERLWPGLPVKACLPDGDEAFFDATGPASLHYEDRRQNCRVYLRRLALLRHERQLKGVYTCDISKSSVGFLSPVQLFPMQQTQLILSQKLEFLCRVMRCHRKEAGCYEIGVDILNVSSDELFRELLRAAQRGGTAGVL